MNLFEHIDNLPVTRTNEEDYYKYEIVLSFRDNILVSKESVKEYKGHCKREITKHLRDRLKRKVTDKIMRLVDERLK